jgi:hypothetical protein
MKQLKHLGYALLCLYYLMLAAWAEHHNKARLIT